MCFPVIIIKFKNPFLIEHLRWVLLIMGQFKASISLNWKNKIENI